MRELRARRKESGLVDYRRPVNPDYVKSLDDHLRGLESGEVLPAPNKNSDKYEEVENG